MSRLILDSEYRDTNQFPILWSDNVRSTHFYDSSSESWDRSGGGIASWYTERDFPNDLFYTQLHSDRWYLSGGSTLKYVTIDDKITFTVDNDEGSLYIKSDGLWSLSGDFEIRLGLIEEDHYDEYRGSTSFGLNISIGQNYNVRVAKVRNYEDTTTKYQALFTENSNPLYFGWSPLRDARTKTGSRDYLTIKRVNDTISCYLGTTYLGGISGSAWSGDASVSIGAESTQINKFTMSADYFNVISGNLTTPVFFNSDFRGPTREFPEKSLLVIDDSGLSIVDYPSYSLWARFRLGSSRAFKSADSKLTALNGRVYCANSNGFFIFDFIDDKVYQYSGSSLKTSDVGLSLRNSRVAFTTSLPITPILSNNVVGVAAKNIDGHEFVAAATTSGINLIIDKYVVKQNTEGHPPATTIHFSSNNSLYWANFNTDNEGDLSYYNSVGLLATITGTTFDRHGYYDSSTEPYTLSSENIYSIHTANYQGADQIALGSVGGVDMLVFPPADSPIIKGYGILNQVNPISDPSFTTNLGSSWRFTSNIFNPLGIIDITDTWSTEGSTSLRLRPGFGDGDVPEGSYFGVFQRIDLTGISKIYFDARVTPNMNYNTMGQVYYQVVVDDTVLTTVEERHLNDLTYMALTLDVLDFTGYHDFIIRMYANEDNPQSVERYAYFDNFRVDYNPSQFEALGGSDAEVLEVFLTYTDSSKKIVYATKEGYGSLDVDDDTSDFFVTSSGIQSGLLINSAEFVSYDSV